MQDFLNKQAEDAASAAREAASLRDSLSTNPSASSNERDAAEHAAKVFASEAESARIRALNYAYYNPPAIEKSDGRSISLYLCCIPMMFFWWLFDVLLQYSYDCCLNIWHWDRGVLITVLSLYLVGFILLPLQLITMVGMIPLSICMLIYKYTDNMAYCFCAAVPLIGLTLCYLRYIPSLILRFCYWMLFLWECIFRLLFCWIPRLRKCYFGYKTAIVVYGLVPIILLIVSAKTSDGCWNTLKNAVKPRYGEIVRYSWRNFVSKTITGEEIPPEIYGLKRDKEKAGKVKYNPLLEAMVQKKMQMEKMERKK